MALKLCTWSSRAALGEQVCRSPALANLKGGALVEVIAKHDVACILESPGTSGDVWELQRRVAATHHVLQSVPSHTAGGVVVAV
eukprot:3200239-Alexandrium_andersonii.AAC.1